MLDAYGKMNENVDHSVTERWEKSLLFMQLFKQSMQVQKSRPEQK